MASHLESLRTTAGQDHDRLTRDETLTLPRSISTPIAGGPGGDPIESTAVQKMLSATTGSLLTALLMTPLDVVRIRWQSQALKPQATTIATDFQKLAVSTPNAFRPTNLGVTACCREVFFMNNNTDVCLAGPRIGSTGPGVGSGPSSAGAAECAVEQTQQRTFTSTLDGLRKIARNEGVFTLWRGLSPTLLMAIPGNIIYFTGYEWLRSNERSPIARHVRENYAALVAGSAARVIAATAVNPIELFRTRLMASHGESAAGHVRDTFRGLADEVATHGYRSLWRGLTLTFWRDVPFSGMYWLGYETIRGKLTDARERARGRSLDLDGASSRGRARRRSQSRENHTDTFTDSFIAGAASGAFASVATMPFDVGKTRTQVSRSAATKLADGSIAVPHEERNMVRLLWHIFTTEGMAGLFKGWIPRTLKVAPACAIMISSYEIGKRTFQGANERADLQRQAAERRDVR